MQYMQLLVEESPVCTSAIQQIGGLALRCLCECIEPLVCRCGP